MDILISVITPVYNAEKFMAACIENFLQQNCPCSEQVIVDGNSDDSTLDIIRSYANQHSNIRWISEVDKGQSDAMNKGIHMARGSIISFLNADDFYEPDVLNTVSKIANKSKRRIDKKPLLILGNCNIWNNDNQIEVVNKPRRMGLTDLLMGWEINPSPVNPSAYFYHKSLHDIIGLYNVDEHYIMDFDFMLRAVQVAKVKYVDEVWGNFRFVKGAKTYDDMTSGEGEKRRQLLQEKYKSSLSLRQKIKLDLSWVFVNFKKSLLLRISYFRRHPDEIYSSLLSKFNLTSKSD